MEEIIIKERELRENLIQLINSSGLPAFILKPIVKEIYDQVINIENQQYEEAKQKINEKQEKKGENNEQD